MRVLIDVNHPKDVHIFKNLYFILLSKGYEVKVTASKKPLTYELLQYYDIPFVRLGSYGSTNISKFINLFWLNFLFMIRCLQWRPDVMIGHISFRVSQIGWLLRIGNFCFSDTDSAPEQIRLYAPFAGSMVTPECFRVDFGDKHIRFKGYNELAYLHPSVFRPDWQLVRGALPAMTKDTVFSIVRFVAWNATHDQGKKGFTDANKIELVNTLSKYGHVFITSETEVPERLKSYVLNFPVQHIHHLIAYASVVVGESATMATEAACLGVPAVYVDHQGTAYTHHIEKEYGVLRNFTPSKQSEAIAFAEKILSIAEPSMQVRNNSLVENSVDLTSFQLSLIESYHSKQI